MKPVLVMVPFEIYGLHRQILEGLKYDDEPETVVVKDGGAADEDNFPFIEATIEERLETKIFDHIVLMAVTNRNRLVNNAHSLFANTRWPITVMFVTIREGVATVDQMALTFFDPRQKINWVTNTFTLEEAAP